MKYSTTVLLLTGALCAAVITPGSTLSHDRDENQLVRLYQELAPATVYLSVRYPSPHPLAELRNTGVGAGFLIDSAGTVLTNAHVVAGASTINATLFDGTQVTADVMAADPVQDIAILQLPTTSRTYPAVMLGDSSSLHVGQDALVVGSPFGLGFTLTSGIISGLGPTIGLPGFARTRIIQTTAPINPGNSGGPLVDSKGRVIGITTATLMGAQNIGFAIPINIAKDILAEFAAKGSITRPWLGIGGKFPPEPMIALFAVPLGGGLLIEDIEDGSPAAEAGLMSGTLRLTIEDVPWILGGDILLSLNGQPTADPESFNRAIGLLTTGQRISVDILRKGERQQLWVELRDRPKSSTRHKATSPQPAIGSPSHKAWWAQTTPFIAY